MWYQHPVFIISMSIILLILLFIGLAFVEATRIVVLLQKNIVDPLNEALADRSQETFKVDLEGKIVKTICKFDSVPNSSTDFTELIRNSVYKGIKPQYLSKFIIDDDIEILSTKIRVKFSWKLKKENYNNEEINYTL